MSKNYGNITKCFHHEDTSNLHSVALFQMISISTYVHMDAFAHSTHTNTQTDKEVYIFTRLPKLRALSFGPQLIEKQ